MNKICWYLFTRISGTKFLLLRTLQKNVTDITPLNWEFSMEILSYKKLTKEQINTSGNKYDPSFLQ